MAPDHDPLHTVVERVGAEYPSPCHFVGYELEAWPPGTASAMVTLGLLSRTTRATSVLCTGFEFACHKPVIVRTKPGANVQSAFLTCNEEPDLGRIPVRRERLCRYRASLSTVARTLANCFQLDPIRLDAQRDRVVIGNIRGRNGPREFALVVKRRRIWLTIGSQERSLTDLLSWRESAAVIDRRETKRMADRKDLRATSGAPANDREPSPTQARTNAIVIRDREIMRHGKRLRSHGKSWAQVAEEIAKMTFIAAPENDLRPIGGSTVRRILTRITSTE